MNMVFDDRINYKGNLDAVIERVVSRYSLGTLDNFSVIEVGFEDYNLKIVANTGKYLAKVFSRKRSDEDIRRYVETIAKVVDAGVQHPLPIKLPDSNLLYTDSDSGLKLVVMQYIEGQTFYEMERLPNKGELGLICAEAVKIHALDYNPVFIFDSWAIPNMKWMYDKTKEHLTEEGLRLVGKAYDYFEAIPFDDLPKCFVHGDLTKANTIRRDDGKIYIIDFAVSNTYPRIQELAVMAANLMFDEKAQRQSSLKERVEIVTQTYLQAGGELTQIEKDNVFNYALPAAAMEYMGSVNERIVGDDSAEIAYWEKLGLESLRDALG
jgi:Ser/Thr protein kinase RdoA (MazF antagonist)